MDNVQAPIDKISDVINQSNSGVIVLQPNPTIDAIGAATALHLGLLKIQRTTYLACTNPPQSNLAGAHKIQSSLISGGDNLVISFPYIEGSIDKVDYNIQGNFFNLVVVPRPGYPKLDTDKVKFTYTGAKIDYIIAIDSPSLNGLGQLYSENQQHFQGKNIINIDRHIVNNSYGTVNYINKTSSSTSELVFHVLRGLQIEIDKDIATNLYTGLLSATNNFTAYSVNPGTFEAASELMRLGAEKKAIGGGGQTGGLPRGNYPSQFSNQSMSQPSQQFGRVSNPSGVNGNMNGFSQSKLPPNSGNSFSYQGVNNNYQQTAPISDQQGFNSTQKISTDSQMNRSILTNQPYINDKPIDNVEQDPDKTRETSRPQDWLKPKIFTGKNNRG